MHVAYPHDCCESDAIGRLVISGIDDVCMCGCDNLGHIVYNVSC